MIVASSLMPARIKSDRRLEPPLVPLDAQLGAAGDDDRARVLRAEFDGIVQPTAGGRRPSPRLDQRSERPGTRPARRTSRARDRGSTVAATSRRIDRQCRPRGSAIAGAPAEVAGQARRGARRRRPDSAIEEPRERVDKPRRAEPALRTVVLDHRLLDRAEVRPSELRPSIVTMCVPSS